MKKLQYLCLVPVFLACLITAGCDLLTEDALEEECKETDLTPSETWKCKLQLKLTSYITVPTADHKIYDAEQIVISGNLRKMNCREYEDSYQEVSWMFSGDAIPEDQDECYLDLTDFIDWTFLNEEDFFSFTFTMAVSFKDFTLYRAEESTQNSPFYRSIKVNPEPYYFIIYPPNYWTLDMGTRGQGEEWRKLEIRN